MDTVPADVATDQDLDSLTSLFKLLSDKTRLHLLLLLAQGEKNVTSLCEAIQLPQPTVSHHLALLREQSLLANRRAGKQVFYQLDGRMDAKAGGAITIRSGRFEVSFTPIG